MLAASLKLNGRTGKAILGISGCLVVVLVACTFIFGGGESTVMKQKGAPSTKNVTAETNEQRIAFIAQFGWEVATEPIEVEDVLVPKKFDKLYGDYNDLQKSQGLNLSRYSGKKVKRYCYEVLNYQGTDEMVILNLLVADKKVVGGDVSSTMPGGFVHGFTRPGETPAETPAKAPKESKLGDKEPKAQSTASAEAPAEGDTAVEDTAADNTAAEASAATETGKETPSTSK